MRTMTNKQNASPKPFKVNWNQQTATLLTFTAEASNCYPTFQITLKHVNEVFRNKTQSWDRESIAAKLVHG